MDSVNFNGFKVKWRNNVQIPSLELAQISLESPAGGNSSFVLLSVQNYGWNHIVSLSLQSIILRFHSSGESPGIMPSLYGYVAFLGEEHHL